MTHGQHHNHMALRKSLPACHNIKFMVEADRITNLHNTFLLEQRTVSNFCSYMSTV